MLFAPKIFILVLIIVSSCILVENRSYNNGLIFYDLTTKHIILPPTVSVSRGRSLSNVKFSNKGSIWSTFGKPCDCAGPLCGCCVGIKVKQYNFDQKMCANVTYVGPKNELNLEMFVDEKQSAKYAVSARNPSPFCIPVMLGIPMSMCVQMSDVGLQGDNMHACMDFMVQLASTQIFEMHFQCMQLGAQGAQWVLPGGGPVIPPSQSKITDRIDHNTDEYYDEEEEEEEGRKEEEGELVTGGEEEKGGEEEEETSGEEAGDEKVGEEEKEADEKGVEEDEGGEEENTIEGGYEANKLVEQEKQKKDEDDNDDEEDDENKAEEELDYKDLMDNESSKENEVVTPEEKRQETIKAPNVPTDVMRPKPKSEEDESAEPLTFSNTQSQVSTNETDENENVSNESSVESQETPKEAVELANAVQTIMANAITENNTNDSINDSIMNITSSSTQTTKLMITTTTTTTSPLTGPLTSTLPTKVEENNGAHNESDYDDDEQEESGEEGEVKDDEEGENDGEAEEEEDDDDEEDDKSSSTEVKEPENTVTQQNLATTDNDNNKNTTVVTTTFKPNEEKTNEDDEADDDEYEDEYEEYDDNATDATTTANVDNLSNGLDVVTPTTTTPPIMVTNQTLSPMSNISVEKSEHDNTSISSNDMLNNKVNNETDDNKNNSDPSLTGADHMISSIKVAVSQFHENHNPQLPQLSTLSTVNNNDSAKELARRLHILYREKYMPARFRRDQQKPQNHHHHNV
ncbi:uncharacterized protein [Musca autumnalis]|uniref:uncharacterized protein n=1 Tax=Musca autumnalis TaxID=221902 RepID=UPI003CE87981